MIPLSQPRPGSTADRCYESYASTHAGVGDGRGEALAYRRYIRPHLSVGGTPTRVLDIGCGQGALVRLMIDDGVDAHGVDISPEQVALAQAGGLDQVKLGDFHDHLRAGAGTWDVIVATDILEHLDPENLMRTFDDVLCALRPGGVFVARVPNAVSPTGGHIMYGDITHRTWFTRRSVAQLAAVAGFADVRFAACPPPVHGAASLLRSLVWRLFSLLWKLALAAETGQLRGHLVTQNLVFVARAPAR